jgi:hypothetical protein
MRRLSQFSLRTLFVVMTLVGLACAAGLLAAGVVQSNRDYQNDYRQAIKECAASGDFDALLEVERRYPTWSLLCVDK